MDLLLLLALAASPRTADSANLAGQYQAVTETEYSITLTLEATGKARFEFMTWEADGSAPERQEALYGTWHRSLDQLTLQFSFGRSATYSIVPCLSYREFGQAGCSPGLSLTNTNLADRYGLRRFGLWNSAPLRRNAKL